MPHYHDNDADGAHNVRNNSHFLAKNSAGFCGIAVGSAEAACMEAHSDRSTAPPKGVGAERPISYLLANPIELISMSIATRVMA
jgi:hypothetical protein